MCKLEWNPFFINNVRTVINSKSSPAVQSFKNMQWYFIYYYWLLNIEYQYFWRLSERIFGHFEWLDIRISSCSLIFCGSDSQTHFLIKIYFLSLPDWIQYRETNVGYRTQVEGRRCSYEYLADFLFCCFTITDHCQTRVSPDMFLNIPHWAAALTALHYKLNIEQLWNSQIYQLAATAGEQSRFLVSLLPG